MARAFSRAMTRTDSLLRSLAIIVGGLFALGMHCHRPVADAPDVNQPVVAAVAAPVCGDGLVTVNEQCDDGNVAAGDGCVACKTEEPRCAPGTDGILVRWSCDGMPNRCRRETCKATGANADCPADLATSTLTTTIRLEGFIDAAARDDSRIGNCACRDTLAGRVCDPACVAKLATCERTTLTAASSTADFARWSSDCAGTAPTCRIQTHAKATVEAQLEAAPVALAGAIVIDGARSLGVLAFDGPASAVLIAGAIHDGATLGGVTLGTSGNGRSFVAQVTRTGVIGNVVDLGDADRVVVHAGAFAPAGGVWLVTSEGDQRHYSDSQRDHPRFVVARYHANGRRIANVELGQLERSVRVASLPADGLAVAFTTIKPVRVDGRLEWARSGFAVIAVDARGHVRWRIDHRADFGRFDLTAMRALGDHVMMAGHYQTSTQPAGALRTLATTPSDGSVFVARIDPAGGIRAWTPAIEKVSAGSNVSITPRGELVLLRPVTNPQHPYVLERRTATGVLAWARPIGKASIGTMWIDPRTLTSSTAGDRFAWIQHEIDDVQDSSRGHLLIQVVDAAGTYLHAWSMPVRTPTGSGPALAGIAAGGRPILVGSGQVRVAGQTSVVWLEPEARPPVAH
jgi:cysteine-rich repeat protein